ncbi:MAG: hypothetical protein E7576_02995 [Ruminococcaceae bacterium]|nr:hypothetical protein [Oscillospiraceae bacterium]
MENMKARLDRAKRELRKSGLYVRRFRKGYDGWMIVDGNNIIVSGDHAPLTLEDVIRWAEEK